METELTVLQQKRVSQAQKVLMYLFEDASLTVPEACQMRNIEPSTYRYWLVHGGEAIEETRRFIDEQQRQLISEIAIAKGKVIRMMIDDATNIMTKPSDRINLFKALDEELSELQSVYNVRPGIEEEAHAFLKQGPTMKRRTLALPLLILRKPKVVSELVLTKQKILLRDRSYIMRSRSQNRLLLSC